jgi:O-antigen/teichoic acid export membrane protein
MELDTLAVRFVGSYAGTGRWGLLRGYSRFSRATVLTASIGIALIGVIVITQFPDVITEKHPYFHASLLVTCVLLPVVSLLMLESATLQGFQEYVRAQLPVNLLRPVTFGVVVLALWVFRRDLITAPVAVAANLCGALTAIAFAWTWRRRATPAEMRAAAPERDVPLWMRTSVPLFAVSLAQTILSQQTDVLVVGTFLTTADVAVYGAAAQLTLPLMLAASSVTFVAQPLIADLYARDQGRLQSLVRFVTWVSFAFTVPVALVLILGGPWLLGLYGPDYGHGHAVLVILTLAQLVVGLAGGLAGFLLTMTAHEREAAWIIGGTAVLNITLAIILTPRYGAVGTASATLVAVLVRAAVLRRYVSRTMSLRVPAL